MFKISYRLVFETETSAVSDVSSRYFYYGNCGAKF